MRSPAPDWPVSVWPSCWPHACRCHCRRRLLHQHHLPLGLHQPKHPCPHHGRPRRQPLLQRSHRHSSGTSVAVPDPRADPVAALRYSISPEILHTQPSL